MGSVCAQTHTHTHTHTHYIFYSKDLASLKSRDLLEKAGAHAKEKARRRKKERRKKKKKKKKR
jgi:hypothetical protein